MCNSVRMRVYVCEGLVGLDICVYAYLCIRVLTCVHLMAPHHNNIIYIKNNASYAYDRPCAEKQTACE